MKELFRLSKGFRLALGLIHLPIQWVMGKFSLGAKVAREEGWSTAKVKNGWSYISTHLYAFMVCTVTTLLFDIHDKTILFLI